jgi:carbon monoxide dehydrogenase subunit G
MYFEKEFVLKKPLQEVWTFVVTPETIAPCIPGVESVETIDATHYRAKVKVGVSFVTAMFGLIVEIIERRDPTFLKSRIKGKDSGIGSSISAETTLELMSLSEQETRVKFGANFVFTGQVASLGRSIMQAKTEEQTALFVNNVRRNIGDLGAHEDEVKKVGAGRMARMLVHDVGSAVKDRLVRDGSDRSKEERQ